MLTPIRLDLDKFIIFHLLLPLALSALLFFGLELTGLDLWISGHFYSPGHKQWPYDQNWLAETAIHIGGRYFIYMFAAVVFMGLLASFRPASDFKSYRKPLCFLLLASVLGPVVISMLKNHTHIYCPRDLSIFGGNKPYIRLFDKVTTPSVIGHCFPAAHAGSGFTFVSLYFFFKVLKRELRFYGLYFGLLLGLVFGFAQQARGAHFFSHDVFAFAVDWLSCLSVFILFFRKQIVWL